jgi:hypothetical protein
MLGGVVSGRALFALGSDDALKGIAPMAFGTVSACLVASELDPAFEPDLMMTVTLTATATATAMEMRILRDIDLIFW